MSTASALRVPPDDLESALRTWFRDRGRVLIGFSGGVDSAYLAVIARQTLGREHVLAVLGRSASVAAGQWETARAVAEAHDVPLREVDTDELANPSYAANPSNRCYFCKQTLWTELAPIAATFGYSTIVDGTNADDLGDHRPGRRAADELGVETPLATLGFTKAHIRERSRVHGIATWDRPSSPCLASRIPYGTAVTIERLAQVERAEAALRALGITGDLRVRHHDDLARIELELAQLEAWCTPHGLEVLTRALQAVGYAEVALDLQGFRSGSLNVLGGVVAA
jgi:uncharacterized protein